LTGTADCCGRWRLSVDGTERAVLADLFAGSCGDKVVTIPARAI
jgi:hypothetical protein